MKRRLLAAFVVICALFCIVPCTAQALESPSLMSSNYYVYNATDDNELFDKKGSEEISIASMTKVVTALTALSKIDDLDEQVTITAEMLSTVEWDESVAGISAGEVLTYKDLLYGMLLPSGGDCARALAYALSGGIEEFAAEMTAFGKSIGMTDSHFVNVSGSEVSGHRSTVHDVAIAFAYGLENETFKQIVCTTSYKMSNGKTVELTLQDKKDSADLENMDRILGGKTGYTDQAGYCLVSFFESGDRTLVVCTAGSTSSPGVVSDAMKVINFVDANYDTRALVQEGIVMRSLPVLNGNVDALDLVSDGSIQAFLPSDFANDLTLTYDVFPLDALWCDTGDTIGYVNYFYKDLLIARQALSLSEDDIEVIRDTRAYTKVHQVTITQSYLGLMFASASVLCFIIAVILLVALRTKRKKEKECQSMNRNFQMMRRN